MIDFHNHIIFDVDDGAQDIEQSIKMLKEAQEAGITDVILTPHYMEEYYEVGTKAIAKRMEIINQEIEKNNINIKLHQSNEVYITSNIINLLKNERVSTVAGSKYVLMETPMLQVPMNFRQIIYDLKSNGYIPVIAHPERYEYIQKNPQIVYDLIQDGVLFQSNIGSIIGIYGNDAKKTVKKLLKHKMVHFIGTDTHRPNSIYPKVEKALKKLNKIVPEDELEKITCENAKCVLENKDIDIPEPIEIK